MARSGEEGEKTFLLLEAGVRLHTTEACLSLQHCPAVWCRLFGRVACVIPPSRYTHCRKWVCTCCANSLPQAQHWNVPCSSWHVQSWGGVLVCGHMRLVSSLCGAGARAEFCMCADAGGEERPALQLCAEAAETPAQPQVRPITAAKLLMKPETQSVPNPTDAIKQGSVRQLLR